MREIKNADMLIEIEGDKEKNRKREKEIERTGHFC